MPVDSATVRAETGIADPTVLAEVAVNVNDGRWIAWLNAHMKKGRRKIKPVELRARVRKRMTMTNVMRAFGFAPPPEVNDPDWRPPPKG